MMCPLIPNKHALIILKIEATAYGDQRYSARPTMDATMINTQTSRCIGKENLIGRRFVSVLRQNIHILIRIQVVRTYTIGPYLNTTLVNTNCMNPYVMSLLIEGYNTLEFSIRNWRHFRFLLSEKSIRWELKISLY